MRRIYKPWVKVHIRLLHNADIGELPDSSKWRFIECLLMAGEERNRALEEGRADPEGFLPPLKHMAFTVRTTAAALQDDLSRLAMAGLVEIRPHESSGEDRWFVTNFAKWQEPTGATERQRFSRSKRKNAEEKEEEERGRIRIIDVANMSHECHENVTAVIPPSPPPVVRHEPADRTPGGNGYHPPADLSPSGASKKLTAEQVAVGEMANAITEVTGVSARLNWHDPKTGNGVGDLAVDLVAAGYTAAQVRQHYSRNPVAGRWHWYSAHWKGKRGELPTVKDVRESIAGATAQRAAVTQKKPSQIDLALALFGTAGPETATS